MFEPGTDTRVPIATTATDLCNFAKIRASNQDFEFQLSDSCYRRVLASLIVFQWGRELEKVPRYSLYENPIQIGAIIDHTVHF